jgi:hypothetical protein
MRNPTPLPLGKVDSTVHASARTAAHRVSAIALGDIEKFGSVQESVEFFTLMKNWADVNLANIEQLAAGVQTKFLSQASAWCAAIHPQSVPLSRTARQALSLNACRTSPEVHRRHTDTSCSSALRDRPVSSAPGPGLLWLQKPPWSRRAEPRASTSRSVSARISLAAKSQTGLQS